MRYIFLLLILISQSSSAEWMQGFLRVTCAPQLGYFEISPHWVSGPNIENLLDEKTGIFSPESRELLSKNYGLYPIGYNETIECINETPNPKYNRNIKVVLHKETPFFDLHINGMHILKGISAREDFPENRFSKDPEKPPTYISFQSFSVNGSLWTMKADISIRTQEGREPGQFRITKNVYKDKIDPVDNEAISEIYLNKRKQKD